MKKLYGKPVYKGIVMGPVVVLKSKEQTVKRTKIENVDMEIDRLKSAGQKAKEQLQSLYEKALKEVGEASAAIFEVHQMMLEDDDYLDSIHNIIQTEMVNAEYAVAVTGDNFAEMFASMDDDYMQARSADIKDISNRLISNLEENGKVDFTSMEPSIIVADDLSPSETVQMDKEKILAFATAHGSTNSHTAILARMMNIPALIGIPINEDMNGKMAIIDGEKGELILDPDEEALAYYYSKKQMEEKQRELLMQLKGKADITLDGKKIRLYANIGNVGDVAKVLENDAAGIGLFRSEFLYLEKNDYPTEEEQFQAYRTVLQNMSGKKVIIRTLDIGADKQVDYFNLEKEDNPALGYRAIRICLDRPEIFKTQLRALLRASAYGDLGVMYPMIISLQELKQAKEIFNEVKSELDRNGIPYGKVEQGVMIETPAAVMISRQLAKEVDFFSIGTNDLTQYTLAIDRQNAKLDQIYDAHHPAVLEMIRMTVENGHENGCWVGICGELGADTTLTKTFLEMGVDELSVSPARILQIREIIRNTYL